MSLQEDKARYEAQRDALGKNIESLSQLRLKVMGAIEYIDILVRQEKAAEEAKAAEAPKE